MSSKHVYYGPRVTTNVELEDVERPDTMATDSQDYEPVSPLDAPPMDFPSTSSGHVVDQWRPSIDAQVQQETSTAIDKQTWAPPPLPPIPREKEPEAWRKRSLKRCSYASQMSNYSITDLNADPALKHQRKPSPLSLNASIKSTPSRNFSRPTRWREGRVQSVDLNWKLASFNPQNWSQMKKWVHTIAASFVGFACTLASSIVPTPTKRVDGQLQTSSVMSILPLALFAAGLAFGSLLSSVGTDLIGRKSLSIMSMTTSALVTLGSAFLTSFYPFVACRIVAAILVSPAFAASLEMLFNVWTLDRRRIPLAIYSATLLLGLILGPLIGPCVLFYRSRGWTQYVILFAFVPVLILLVSTRETDKRTLKRRKSLGDTYGKLSRTRIANLRRPFVVLCARPSVLLCTLHASFNLATFYAILVAFPPIFAQLYDKTLISRGLPFVGMVIGTVVGAAVTILTHSILSCRQRGNLKRSGQIQAAKEKAAQHGHTDSRASITPFRHGSSALAGLDFKNRTSAPVQEPDKNVDVAFAVATHLNNLPLNDGKHITAERVSALLDQMITFPDICLLLEGYDMTFDRSTLAGVMANALPKSPKKGAEAREWSSKAPLANEIEVASPTEDQLWPFTPDSPQVVHAPRGSLMSRKEAIPSQQTQPSPKVPLVVALIGGLLSTGALFMFAWTATTNMAWIVPVVAMGLFACGGTMVFASTTEYLANHSGSTDGKHAVAACSIFRWIFAAVFAIVAVPLFNNLGPKWAVSVLGFVNAGASIIVLSLLISSMVSMDSSRRQSAV